MKPIIPITLCLALFADEPPRQFRHWIGGRDAGSMSVLYSETRVATNNNLMIERKDASVEQCLTQDITRNEKGFITADWTMALAAKRQRGHAFWSPGEPGVLRISQPGKGDSLIKIGTDVLLWPPDIDEKMRLAAMDRLPLRIAAFSFPSSSVSYLELTPERPEPVDAFPDSVRYSGTIKEGATISQITCWISPSAGQVSQISSSGGLIVITQRAEIKPPDVFSGPGLFEWTFRKLPYIPFLAWRDEIRVSGLPELTETPQQKKIGRGEYLLSRAAPPGDEEMRQAPIRNQAGIDPADAPFLADSPLLGLNDAAISGLITRLNARPNAARWELACRINTFVFSHIRDKGLEVGFASAPEVAVNPRGDCTEHTVLMVAMLRRLGVPARAVLGWAGLDAGFETSLGLHAWVEVRICNRWVPFDPTFDQAPAGAFRLSTGASNLNSIAELDWNIGLPLRGALGVSAAPFKIFENQIVIDDVSIKTPNGKWNLSGGRLWLEHTALGRFSARGGIRSLSETDAKFIHVRGISPARYTKSLRQLAIDCGKNKWLYLEDLDEGEALAMLREIIVSPSSVH